MTLIQRIMTGVLLVLILLVLFGSCSAQAGTRLHITDYDPHFQRWSARWMPEYDWRWFRAQCYQESRFQARAVSPAGAMGICQIMPGTARDLGLRDPFHAASNIEAGARYMRRMLNVWHWERTDQQRLELAQASYNAGAGHIIRAQRLCGSPVAWPDIYPCLPQVTGHHSAETIGYVRQIRRWYRITLCGM